MPLRGLKATEREQLNAMLEQAYKGASNDHRFLTLHRQKPLEDDWNRIYEYDPAVDTGLNVTQKEIVANVGIYRQYMQYGQALILNGGIRDVASHPKVRGMGYGQLVLKDSVEFMRNVGCDISILFAGPIHFYEKQGWRNGIAKPMHTIAGDEFKRWRISPPHGREGTTEFSANQLEVRVLEEADIPMIAELYSATQSGLYFAATRSEQYWRDPLGIAPAPYFSFFVAFPDGHLIAYCHHQMVRDSAKPKEKQYLMSIEEFRVEPRLNRPGAGELDQILHAFLRFIEDEEMNSGETIGGIQFRLSLNHSVVKHFYLEQYKLEAVKSYHMGIMVQIINPQGLITKITPEIQARGVDGLLPPGGCVFRFAGDGSVKGGWRIDVDPSQRTPPNVRITGDDTIVADWEKELPNGVTFRDLTPLTLLFMGAIGFDELDEEDVTFKGDALPWIEGLFGNVTYDHYDMDHF
jgi:GNAT superfamily N-acetyltransferase